MTGRELAGPEDEHGVCPVQRDEPVHISGVGPIISQGWPDSGRR